MVAIDFAVESLYLDLNVKIWNNNFEVIAMKLLYPEHVKCIACNTEIFQNDIYDLCENCYEEITFLKDYHCCTRCGRPLVNHSDYMYCRECLKRSRHFDRGYSATVYDSVSEKMIFDFKYNDKTYLYKAIGEIMADSLSYNHAHFDLITYVPIHFKRRLSRGFNQSKLIAERISEITGKYLLQNAILRSKNTRRLKNLSMNEREDELKEAFEGRKGVTLEGMTVLLIDDIMTTGTTADRCSKVLKDMGANEIVIATFAVKCNYD